MVVTQLAGVVLIGTLTTGKGGLGLQVHQKWTVLNLSLPHLRLEHPSNLEINLSLRFCESDPHQHYKNTPAVQGNTKIRAKFYHESHHLEIKVSISLGMLAETQRAKERKRERETDSVIIWDHTLYSVLLGSNLIWLNLLQEKLKEIKEILKLRWVSLF